MEKGGKTTKLNWNKSRDGPWTVQSQRQFARPQTETQVVLRQLVAVCVFLLYQTFCLKKKFRGRGLTYNTSSTLQCRPGNSTEQLKKLPGTSSARLSPLLVEVWKGYKNTAEHSCAICSVGRRCLVMQIIFPFHNDIATSPYKPIKKGLVQLISTFKAGEIKCKLKNWSCLYLNGRITFPDLIQRAGFLVFCPIFKWNLLKNCNLHLSISTRTKYIEKSF